MRSAEAARLFKDSSKHAVMRKSSAHNSSCFPVALAEKGRGGVGWLTVPLARYGARRGGTPWQVVK